MKVSSMRACAILALAVSASALPTNVHNVNALSKAGNARMAPSKNPSSLQPKSMGLRGGSGSALSSFITFCDVQHLPIGILIAIFVGLSNPDLGVKAGENQFFATWSIPTIFFINGIKIKAEEAKKAVKNYKALGWGSVCILLLSAVIGCQLSKIAPLSIKEFITGIAVFSCLPSTTVSSPMLAAKAGGNFALALLLTLLVNVIAIFSTPFLLKNLAGISGGGFSVGGMIKRLATTSLTPLLVGKAVTSASSTARDLAAYFSKLLTYISSGVIIFQPWVAISRSTKRGVFSRVTGSEVFILTVIVTVMHLLWQGIEYLGCVGLGLSLASTKSVCIVGGAKNLPLALSLVGMLPATTGDTGLLVLPIVLGHFSTIVCDSILGNYWSAKTDDR